MFFFLFFSFPYSVHLVILELSNSYIIHNLSGIYIKETFENSIGNDFVVEIVNSTYQTTQHLFGASLMVRIINIYDAKMRLIISELATVVRQLAMPE